MKLHDRPIEVIPNPIEIGQFPPPHPEQEEKGLIVFAGTVTARKGIRELVRAMPAIVAAVPEARLEVYGGDDIFPIGGQSLTRTLAESLPPELAGRVDWKGRVPRDQIAPGAQARQRGRLPFLHRGHADRVAGGMASGKAVVASRTGPGPEIIDDGVTGLLCDPFDPASIAEKVVVLLARRAAAPAPRGRRAPDRDRTLCAGAAGGPQPGVLREYPPRAALYNREMSAIGDLQLKIRRGETPLFRTLRAFIKGALRFSVPVPGLLRPLLRFLYELHFAVIVLFRRLLVVFYREPRFAAAAPVSGSGYSSSAPCLMWTGMPRSGSATTSPSPAPSWLAAAGSSTSRASRSATGR